MKNLYFFLLALICLLLTAGPACACTSFAVYGNKVVYGMNFDYVLAPLKFIIDTHGSVKTFHLKFKLDLPGTELFVKTGGTSPGSEAIEAVMNRIQQWAAPKGLFMNGSVLFGAFWGDPDSKGQLIYQACVSIPETITADADQPFTAGMIKSVLPIEKNSNRFISLR